MTKCLTCGGVYAATLPDSARYFHTCPLLSDYEVCVAQGINADPTKQTAADKLTLATAPRVRPNARNENAPDAATQAALLATAKAATPTAPMSTLTKTLDTAIVGAGAGTSLTVDAGQVIASAN